MRFIRKIGQGYFLFRFRLINKKIDSSMSILCILRLGKDNTYKKKTCSAIRIFSRVYVEKKILYNLYKKVYKDILV